MSLEIPEPEHLITRFLNKHDLSTLVATDTSFSMLKAYDAWAIPQIIMVDKENRFAGRVHPDHLTAEAIQELIDGKIPEIEQAPTNMYDPEGAEEYFRSLLE